MSQREVLIVLAHALACTSCRRRLLDEPDRVFTGRSLSALEKEDLGKLTADDFITPELLARAVGMKTSELNEYRDHPVARLRHF